MTATVTNVPGDEDSSLPPPGGYPDPGGGAPLRRWSGNAWASHASSAEGRDRRTWVLTSPIALWVDRVIAVGAGLAAAFGIVTVAAILLVGRPIGGLQPLLIPAIPLLIVGQLWAIFLLRARFPRPTGGFRERMRSSMAMQRKTMRYFFQGLPTRFGTLLIGLFVLLWLAGVTAFPSLAQGGPAAARPGCAWPLENHGAVTCVTRAKYVQAGASAERFAASVLSAFYVVHFGVAAGELRRRRGAGRPEPSTPGEPDPGPV